MMRVFKEKGSSKVHLTQPTGGMFAWMTMPDTVDCDEFFEACMNKNVGIIKCGAFCSGWCTKWSCIPFELYGANNSRN